MHNNIASLKGINFLNCDNKTLSETPPALLLGKCLKSFFWVAKLIGLYPLEICRDGTVSFRFFSKPSIFSFFAFLFFSCNSILFMPFYITVTTRMTQDLADYVAEFIFGFGQYIAGLVTILLIPFMTQRVAKFWNKLQKIVIFIASNNSTYEDFCCIRRRARFGVLIFLWFTCTYGYVCWFYFNPEMIIYYKKDTNIMYYPIVIAFTVFSATMAYHVLHWLALSTFTVVIKVCFDSLINLTKKLENDQKSNLSTLMMEEDNPDISKLKLTEYINIYYELNRLIKILGDIYGIYLIVQTVAMITFTVTNIYFLTSHNYTDDESKSYITIVGAMSAYIFWLYTICCSGDTLCFESQRCGKALLTSCAHQSNPVHCMKIHRLITHPVCLSAYKFFVIDKRLLTTVIGAITTYCIVLIQLKERRRSPYYGIGIRTVTTQIPSTSFE